MITTWNRWDLETLAFSPVMPKKLPGRCHGAVKLKMVYHNRLQCTAMSMVFPRPSWVNRFNTLPHLMFQCNDLRPVYTMDREVGPWEMAIVHGPTSMLRFLKTSIYKVVGLLTTVGVNQTWTKRIDHGLKSDCVDFWICVQKGQFWIFFKSNPSLTILLYCLVFIFFLPPPFPKRIPLTSWL